MGGSSRGQINTTFHTVCRTAPMFAKMLNLLVMVTVSLLRAEGSFVGQVRQDARPPANRVRREVHLCSGMNEIIGGLQPATTASLYRYSTLPADLNDTIASFLPEDFHNFEVALRGPVGSPYEGGTFILQIRLPSRYPFSAPKVRLWTPIFHMNVSERGNFKLNPDLHDTWSPAITIQNVIERVSAMLAKPDPSEALDVRTRQLYESNLGRYNAIARESTRQYAQEPAVR